jgi:WD40 repeat protein
MRVIPEFDNPVRAVAFSPDGRFLAATDGYEVTVRAWPSGEPMNRTACSDPVGQVAFTPGGNWVVFAHRGGLFSLHTGPAKPFPMSAAGFSGGVAVSPDGKTLAATRAGRRGQVRLERWDLPGFALKTGFDFWSPFARLAFSPNGEFLAGIGPDTFELRIAVSGGLNGRRQVRYVGDGFLAFSRDSLAVVFGWETDLHVMETRAGNLLRRVTSPGAAFRDAAFVGRHLATVDGTPELRVWSADSWEVVRGYDWAAGGLTCVAAAADGLAGACGTESGSLVVFDVDE